MKYLDKILLFGSFNTYTHMKRLHNVVKILQKRLRDVFAWALLKMKTTQLHLCAFVFV